MSEGCSPNRVRMDGQPPRSQPATGGDEQGDARINRLARAQAKGDKRRIDQIRADILLDLLTGKNPTRRSPTRAGRDQSRLTTLTGINDEPAEIPVGRSADVARHMSTKLTMRTGGSSLVDETANQQGSHHQSDPPQLRNVSRDRNPTCVSPDVDARRQCDLNHEIPWAQAHRTTIRELGPLCATITTTTRHRWKLKQIRPGTTSGPAHSDTPTPPDRPA